MRIGVARELFQIVAQPRVSKPVQGKPHARLDPQIGIIRDIKQRFISIDKSHLPRGNGSGKTERWGRDQSAPSKPAAGHRWDPFRLELLSHCTAKNGSGDPPSASSSCRALSRS